MSIFRDRSKLMPGFVPENLVDRKEEIKEIGNLFEPVLKDNMSQKVFVHGPGGSGKTTLSLRTGRELEALAGGPLDYVHVDCRKQSTGFRVARSIADRLGKPISDRSTTACLEKVSDHLERKDKHLVIALDWLDFQVHYGDSDLLYSLTRWWEPREEENRISLIGLSRVPDLIKRLDPAVQSTFLHNRVELDPYTEEELEEILKRRAELALRPGSIEESTIELIAESAPTTDGARVAIDWLLHAATIADGEGKDEITPREVGAAKRLAHERVARRDLENLDEQDLLLLLGTVREMSSGETDTASVEPVEERYRKVCAEREREPLTRRTLLGKLERLSDLGMIYRDAGGPGERTEIRIAGGDPAILEGIILELI